MPSLAFGLKLFKNNSGALDFAPVVPQTFSSRGTGDGSFLRVSSDGFARRLTS